MSTERQIAMRFMFVLLFTFAAGPLLGGLRLLLLGGGDGGGLAGHLGFAGEAINRALGKRREGVVDLEEIAAELDRFCDLIRRDGDSRLPYPRLARY